MKNYLSNDHFSCAPIIYNCVTKNVFIIITVVTYISYNLPNRRTDSRKKKLNKIQNLTRCLCKLYLLEVYDNADAGDGSASILYRKVLSNFQ